MRSECEQRAEVRDQVVGAVDERARTGRAAMPAVVQRVQRVTTRRELLARPRIAAAVLRGAMRHTDDGARLARRQPRLPEDLDPARPVEFARPMFHGAGPYGTRNVRLVASGVAPSGRVSNTRAATCR